MKWEEGNDERGEERERATEGNSPPPWACQLAGSHWSPSQLQWLLPLMVVLQRPDPSSSQSAST